MMTEKFRAQGFQGESRTPLTEEKRDGGEAGEINPVKGISSLEFLNRIREGLTLPFAKISERFRTQHSFRVAFAAGSFALGLAGGVLAYDTLVSPNQNTKIERPISEQTTATTEEFLEWSRTLTPKQKTGLLIVGMLSIMPAIAAARGTRTFVRGKGNILERVNVVRDQYIKDDNRAKLITSSAMAAFTALDTMLFGVGRVDVAMTFTGGSILATLLPAWWALAKDREGFSAFILQQLAPAAMAAFVGLMVADHAMLFETGGKPLLYQAEWSPHIIGIAGIGYLALKKYADLGNVSRAHLRDVANLLLEMPKSLRDVLGILETDRLPIQARDLIIAVGQKQIRPLVLNRGGLLDQTFKLLTEELRRKNKEAVDAENDRRKAENRIRIKQGKNPFKLLTYRSKPIRLDFPLSDQKILVRANLEKKLEEELQEIVDIKVGIADKVDQTAKDNMPKRKRNRPKHAMEA